jgi:hypothetical protein
VDASEDEPFEPAPNFVERDQTLLEELVWSVTLIGGVVAYLGSGNPVRLLGGGSGRIHHVLPPSPISTGLSGTESLELPVRGVADVGLQLGEGIRDGLPSLLGVSGRVFARGVGLRPKVLGPL